MNGMTLYLFQLVLVTGAVTLLLRAFPFIAFGRGNKPPELIRYLGDVVSPAAIAMLVVYCYAGYAQGCANMYLVPELVAGAVTAALQLWRRNPLVSILAGTAIYMALIRVAGA